MLKKIAFVTPKLCLLLVALLVLNACQKDPDFLAQQSIISLKWNQGYTDETEGDALLGLKWALSYIGAENLNSSAVFLQKDGRIGVKVGSLELPDFGEKALSFLHETLKLSEEYRVNGAIDVGRYIVLLIGATEHYYQLVGMPNSLGELLAKYTLNTTKGYVNASGVSSKDRIISFSNQLALNQLFVAEEIDPETGEILEFETVDLMNNGQVRFGIFNRDGKRIPAADPFASAAGKPGKCMWCHESMIQPLFEEQLNFEGYLTALQLADTLSYFRDEHHKRQLELNNGIDYSIGDAHELTELLYISFMEPSAQRLALEWGMSSDEVEEMLIGLTTHIHGEFPFLGDLYDRADVDALAPYFSIGVSSSVREKSDQEVNLFE